MQKLSYSWIFGPLLIGILGVGAGCGDAELDQPDSVQGPMKLARAQQGIRGGRFDPDSHAAVGLAINTGRGMSICSGTLILPNLVLTARHCVAPTSSEYVTCGESGFGEVYAPSKLYVSTSPKLFQNSTSYMKAAQVYVPNEGSDMCGYDIALIRLKDPVPAEQATPVEPRIDLPVQSDEVYTAIGYGHTGLGEGSGTRRIIEGLEVDCDGADCRYMSSMLTETEWLGDEGTCQGDSGGGAYDSEGRVLGALSRGGQGCSSSVYSGVSGWADWIRAKAMYSVQIGDYPAPAWVDVDDDGVHNGEDNCPNIANEDQSDIDGDGVGDVCDDDFDGDGVLNEVDNCPFIDNPDQLDTLGNGVGDVCDYDDDGVHDAEDNCPAIANSDQKDTDGDGVGDVCDSDIDDDGVPNDEDNCPVDANPDQEDVCSPEGCSTTSATPPLSLLFHGFGALALLGLSRMRRPGAKG